MRKDRGIKRRLYGGVAVEEYWIVNLVDEHVEVYRRAAEGGWEAPVVCRRGEVLTPRALPGVTIAVAEILPPGR